MIPGIKPDGGSTACSIPAAADVFYTRSSGDISTALSDTRGDSVTIHLEPQIDAGVIEPPLATSMNFRGP